MKPAMTIVPRPWMKNPALASVIKALGEEQALIVGGAVRNALLNEPVTDIDIATEYPPTEVAVRLRKAGIRSIPTGIDHGTLTAVIDKVTFEITTLRRDVDTDGRHAKVAFSKDWVQDARRRDFTINTLLMNLEGHVFDPLGQGIADLKSGVIRFVGDPATRIAEDYLRILRFFRFNARYSHGRPEPEGLKACLAAAGHITDLSKERITQEFEKILAGRHAAEMIDLLRTHDILPGVISPSFRQGPYKILQKLVTETEEFTDKRTLFAYSVWQNESNLLFEKIEKFFVLSNSLKTFLTKNIQFVNHQPDLVWRNLYHFGSDVTLSGSILHSLIKGEAANFNRIKAKLKAIRQTPVPVLPVDGNDIGQLLGIMPGRALGNALKDVEAWWLKEEVQPDREATLNHIRATALKKSD